MKKTITHTVSASTNAYPANEAVLHYLWKTKQVPKSALTTTDGQRVVINDWGQHNKKAGPDFLFASIELDGLLWTGHIEIHVKSSDWYRHHHQTDPAYDLVVLHVVWEDDRPVTDRHLVPIPTITLSSFVEPALLDRIATLINSTQKIPCRGHLADFNVFWLNTWKERQLIERIESRCNMILKRLDEKHGDWEQITMEWLFRSMGFHVNSDAMQELAAYLTWPLVRKINHDAGSLEALLFGAAGFLPAASQDPHLTFLTSTYNFLSHKHAIQSCTYISWHFKGCRPPNFPTIRLAQLASLLTNKYSLLRSLLLNQSIEDVRGYFSIDVHEYWQVHYRPEGKPTKTKYNLSSASIDALIINFVVPILYAYGLRHSNTEITNRALQYLYNMRAENNAVLRLFDAAGIHNSNAADSQALLHTFKKYCSQRQCLSCQIGNRIVSGKK